jgi:hypothetical protein
VAANGITLHDNSRQPAHLAVDNRFHLEQVVRVAQIRAPLVFCMSVASECKLIYDEQGDLVSKEMQ